MTDLAKMTVPQLREQAKFLTDNSVGKLRKAELIALIEGTREQAAQYERDNEAAENAADQILAGAVYAAGDSVEITPEERVTLNEAKYRGRYEGKAVTAKVNRRLVRGTVVDRTHRDSEPFNRGDGTRLLLLAVKHDGAANRVTLHAAEDVALV